MSPTIAAAFADLGAQCQRQPLFDYGKIHASGPEYALVFPQDQDQVQALVQRARAKQIPLRVRGSGHTFNGCSLPRDGELLVRTDHLNHFCFEGPGTVTAGAGAVVWDIRDTLRDYGFDLPVVNGGWSGPTLGGFINAGGFGKSGRPERHGGLWENVEEITFVDGCGQLQTIARDNPKFPWLFGAFGQFGLLVQARLRIIPHNEGTLPPYPHGVSGTIARRQVDDPKVNDLPSGQGGQPTLYWFSLLIPPALLNKAWVDLYRFARRNARHLTPEGGWRGPTLSNDPIGYYYYIRFRQFNPPLLYPAQEPFLLVGVMSRLKNANAAQRTTVLAIERDFVDMAAQRGYKLYVQAGNISRNFDLESYYGSETYDGFRTLKQQFDPDDLINRGIVFTNSATNQQPPQAPRPSAKKKPLPQRRLNALLAKAFKGYRQGKKKTIAMSPAVSGALYTEQSQRLIEDRLSEGEYTLYGQIRDLSRAAVRLARQGQPDEAKALFAQAWNIHQTADGSAQLARLGVSRIAQAEAYLHTRLGAWDQAKATLQQALASDRALELEHGYHLFHIQRIHLLHLLVRAESGSGQEQAAIHLADGIIQYLVGDRDDLPVDQDWSKQQAAAIPLVFRHALVMRIAGDVGILLAKRQPPEAKALWDDFAVWSVLSADDGLAEVYQWGQLQDALLCDEVELFLERGAAFLAAGRRDTYLWYTTVSDLCTICKTHLPRQTRPFRAEVAKDARAMETLPPYYLPSQLRRILVEQDSSSRPKVPSRRFRVYNVGLPRTGTSSLATLFGRYRAATEFLQEQSIEQIIAWRDGQASAELVRDFVEARDRQGRLEIDSASFNHFFLDLLIEKYPEARFIFTVRDCYPWVNAFLKLLVQWRQRYAEQGLDNPQWMAAYGRIFFGRFSWETFADYQALAEKLPQLVEPLIRFWGTTNSHILARLPPERSLVICTQDISKRRDDLAAFVGVPVSSLTEKDHVGANPDDRDVLKDFDRGTFDRLCAQHGQPSLHRLFGR